MNWERAKNILIVFFLLINITLASVLVYINHTSATLSEETIDSVCMLLNKNGIELISKDVIPKRNFKNQSYNLTMLSLNNEKMLKTWLGNGYECTEEDLSKHCFTYVNKNRHLKINKTFIEFNLEKNAVLLSNTSQKEMESYLLSKLKKFGFTNKNYYFRKVWFENGLYNGIISPLAEKTKIVGVELKVSADKEEIIGISGNNFSYSDTETFKTEGLIDIAAVMSNLIYLPEKPTAPINRITYAGYVPEEYKENKSITAIPVYVISCEDGREYLYDARTGRLLTQY
jgi:hypothetical protein